MKKIANSPFTRCQKGHDLTVEDAYLYGNRGERECRACALSKKRPARRTEVYGSFDGTK